MIIRSNGIETVWHQKNPCSVLAKIMEIYTQKGDLVKIIWYNIKSTFKSTNDSRRLWWNCQFCEKI